MVGGGLDFVIINMTPAYSLALCANKICSSAKLEIATCHGTSRILTSLQHHTF